MSEIELADELKKWFALQKEFAVKNKLATQNIISPANSPIAKVLAAELKELGFWKYRQRGKPFVKGAKRKLTLRDENFSSNEYLEFVAQQTVDDSFTKEITPNSPNWENSEISILAGKLCYLT